jgi:hypothetical protein
LRGVILNDDKSSTYKLALLRAVARIADATPALAVPRLDQDAVELPLGLVALNWVRMYLPLVQADLPGRMGWALPRPAFAKCWPSSSPQDLRIGARFTGERARAVAQALTEAARTITRMPANFTESNRNEPSRIG